VIAYGPRDSHGSFDPLTLHKRCRCMLAFRASDNITFSPFYGTTLLRARGKTGGTDTGKRDYRYRSRVGCVNTRWLSTVGIADNVCLSEMRETYMCVMSRPIHQQSFSVRGRLFAYRCSRGQGYDAAFYCGVSCTGNGETALYGT
jgi:hypothetical protein